MKDYICEKCKGKLSQKESTSNWKECKCGFSLEKNGILYEEKEREKIK